MEKKESYPEIVNLELKDENIKLSKPILKENKRERSQSSMPYEDAVHKGICKKIVIR